MTKPNYRGTEIDGVSFDPEGLFVRGCDLNDLIGNFTYPETVYFLFTGTRPSSAQLDALERCLCAPLAAAFRNQPMMDAVGAISRSGASHVRAMIGGLMACGDAQNKDTIEPYCASTGLSVEQIEAVQYLGLLPAILAIASGPPEWPEVDVGEGFVEVVMARFTGKQPSSAGVRTFNDILVAFHAGFGFLTPTVMLARGASGTGMPIPVSIAAGLCAGGANHVGACTEAMQVLQQLREGGMDGIELRIETAIDTLQAEGRRLPGLGHPIFDADPRVDRLRELARQRECDPDYCRIYDLYCAAGEQRLGLKPNVDGVCALLFLALGFDDSSVTGLILCARAAAMTAHIVDRKEVPAFGANRKTLQKWLRYLPAEVSQHLLL